MENFKTRFELPYPLEDVLQVSQYDLFQNMERYKDLIGMSDIRMEKFSEDEHGNHDMELTYSSLDRVPPFARRVIKPEMLRWRQLGHWQADSLAFTFKIIPFFFTKSIDVRGKKQYVPRDHLVEVQVTSRVAVSIPVIGRPLEKIIVNEVRKEMAKLRDKLVEMLEQIIAERGG